MVASTFANVRQDSKMSISLKTDKKRLRNERYLLFHNTYTHIAHVPHNQKKQRRKPTKSIDFDREQVD